MRRGVPAAALAAAVAIVFLAAAAGRAQEPAAVVTEKGWWSRQPGATAPEGGFAVADAPDGAVSVAAVKINVQVQRVTRASFVLTEGDGTGGAQFAAMQACPSPADWQAADPGPMAQAPKADCTKAVDLKRTGTLWQADITALLDRSGPVSISIVPKAGGSAGLPVKAVWNVAVEAVSLEAEGEGRSETAIVAPSPADDDSGSGSIVSGSVVTPPSVTSSFGPARFVPTMPSPPVELEPALNAPPPAAAAEAPAQPVGTFPRRIDTSPPGDGDRRPWARLLFYVPAAALAGAGAAAARRAAQARGWMAASGAT